MTIYRYICQACGKENEKNLKPYKVKNFPPKFCNRECFHQKLSREKESNKKKLKCNYCNKEFLRRPSNVKKRFNFCSRKCKEGAQSVYGGDKFKSMRPEHYTDGKYMYRKRAFDCYGEQCRQCGYSKCNAALQVHHIDKDRKNNRIDNLEVLCRNCHAEMHFCITI